METAAIQGAKEIGVDVSEAASAAATGAIKAAGNISEAAVELVQKAATGMIAGVEVVANAPFAKYGITPVAVMRLQWVPAAYLQLRNSTNRNTE